MEKLSERINKYRQKKGYSQELLAEMTGLNLRTIQRIEKGETLPRGDSLQRLSKALGTSPDNLIDWTTKEDKSILILLNLTQFSFLAFPLLGTLIPMAIWILQKDKVMDVNKLGKSILNFQISWALLFFLFSGPTLYLHVVIMPADVFAVGTVLLYAYNITLILANTILTIKNKKWFYKPSLKILSE